MLTETREIKVTGDVRIGGTLVTSREALQRFAERCSESLRTEEQPEDQLDDLEQIERELDERGL